MGGTVRVAAAEGCIGYDVAGRRFNTDKSGHIEMPTHAARQVIDAGGAFIPGTGFAHLGKRLRCPACGFAPLFQRCKCGTDAVEEN